MKGLPISVVIVARNAEKTLEKCLVSTKNNQPKEIIVVDGISSDNTLYIARRYTNMIFSDEGKGVSFARQLGAEKASQEYIAYIDSDIVLENGALLTMLQELRSGRYSAIRAKIRALKCDTYLEKAADRHFMLPQSKITGGVCAGVTRKDIVLKIKFSSSIKGEDYDFFYRANHAGYLTGISSVIAHHAHRATLKSFIQQRFWYGRSKSQLILKLGWKNAEMWAPLVTSYWLGYCLVKANYYLIPYFVLDGLVETAGMLKGFFELIWDRRIEL
jgi:glycosyltransferase involved in cell wall biosynthesis